MKQKELLIQIKEIFGNIRGFIEDKDKDKAAKFIEEYEKEVPDDYRISFIKALISLEDNDINVEECKNLIIQGIKKSPLNYEYNYNMNLAQIALDNNEYLKALEIYERILAEVENLEVKNEIRQKIDKLENKFTLNIRNEFEKRSFETKEVNNMKKNYKNLHLMVDSYYSKRFIKFMNKHFSCEENLFLILDYKENLLYMEENMGCNVRYVKLKDGWEKCLDVNTQDIIYLINNSQQVFIHYLNDFVTWLVCRYDIKTPMNWILWGSDLYENIDINLYDEFTKKFLTVDCNLKIKDFKNTNEYIYRKSAIRKFNKIIPDGIKGDYFVAKEFFTTSASYEHFVYPNPVDFITLDNNNFKVKEAFNLKKKYKYVIQLGNSGDPSNNHLEAIEILSKMKENNFCVVCPLSYGNSPYINKLIPKIKEILGDRFVPLTNFLNTEDYFSILNQVDVAIMNHNRQQATSNILPLFYLGKKVYMKNHITTYSTFKELGLNVFDVNQIDFKDFTNFIEMDLEDRINNKSIILNNYNEEILLENIKKIF